MRTSIYTLLIALALPTITWADGSDLKKDFNSLGNNTEIIRRAKEMDPHNRVRIVQNRLVDRHMRLELGVNVGAVHGGDTYLNTRNLGANIDFHINPRWSVGVRYYQSYNELTQQGKKVYQDAAAANAADASAGVTYDIDYPINTTLAVVNWYPIYGKLNLFEVGVSQFDIYTLAGYGQVKLESGATDTFTVGGGVGLWLTQHVSSRLEARYQRYTDQVYSGPRDLDLTVITASIGFIL